MESGPINQNPMPEIRLFPSIEKVASALGKLGSHIFRLCPLNENSYMSEHYREHPLDTPLFVQEQQTSLWD